MDKTSIRSRLTSRDGRVLLQLLLQVRPWRSSSGHETGSDLGGANGTRTPNPLLANILSPRISLGIARLAGATAGAEERGTRPALGSDWGRTTAPCDRCLIRDARPSGRRRADGCGRPGLSVVVDLLAGAVLLSLVRRRWSSPTADLPITSRRQGMWISPAQFTAVRWRPRTDARVH
jgi:hypothetical protein